MAKKKLSLEEVATAFLNARAAKALAETELDKLAKILKPALRKAPEQELVLCRFLFRLEQGTQDHFKLSDAKKKIALSTLRPFITRAKFEKIRTKFLGENEELACA
jgi:hypothetical protein